MCGNPENHRNGIWIFEGCAPYFRERPVRARWGMGWWALAGTGAAAAVTMTTHDHDDHDADGMMIMKKAKEKGTKKQEEEELEKRRPSKDSEGNIGKPSENHRKNTET